MYVKDWFKPLFPLILTSLPHKVPYAHFWFWFVLGDCPPPHTIHRKQGPLRSWKNRCVYTKNNYVTCKIFNHFKKHTILFLFYQHYIIFMHIILTKSCKILHYWYNICMFIMAYFIAVCFKDMFMSAPWRWQDNSTETCSSCVKHCTHKLQNRAFVGVTWVIYF